MMKSYCCTPIHLRVMARDGGPCRWSVRAANWGPDLTSFGRAMTMRGRHRTTGAIEVPRSLRLGTLLGLAVTMAGAANVSAMPIHLVPNRATYDLRLEHTSPGGAVAAHGRMIIQFRDTCDGWSTAQRTVADLTDADGAISRSDFLIAAWESKDGKTMRFDVKNANGGKLDKEKRGTATLTDDGDVIVSLLAPVRREFALPVGTVFPTAQTEALVAAAARGQRNVKRVVFEGGDEGDLYVSTAVIGRPAMPQATAAEHVVDEGGLIRNVPAWTVLVGYFDNKRGAELPEYEIATRLYANGIGGSMSLVYPRYTLRATLTRIEPLTSSCPTDQAVHAEASRQ
jgi:hypothetical protein